MSNLPKAADRRCDMRLLSRTTRLERAVDIFTASSETCCGYDAREGLLFVPKNSRQERLQPYHVPFHQRNAERQGHGHTLLAGMGAHGIKSPPSNFQQATGTTMHKSHGLW